MDKIKPRRPDVVEAELIGGIEKRQLELKRYDDRWLSMYLEHQRRIRDALSALEVEVEHIGSTSVPGLAAKPIIDIVVTVHDITAEEDYLNALLAAGYELRVREPGHRLVRTPARDVLCTFFRAETPPLVTTSCFEITYARMRTTAPYTNAPNRICSLNRGTT